MLIGSVDNTIQQQNTYANKAENHQTAGAVDKTDNASQIESSSDFKEPHDEYIPSGDKKHEKSPGIYRLEKDENGRQKIVCDRPVSSEKSEQAEAAEKKEPDGGLPEEAPKQDEDGAKSNGPEKSGDKKEDMQCTANTDKVDAEIKKLKEEKQQIEQELKSACDEDKRKDLEKQLSQVESELSAKDNDTYRKQHADYTND